MQLTKKVSAVYSSWSFVSAANATWNLKETERFSSGKKLKHLQKQLLFFSRVCKASPAEHQGSLTPAPSL